MTFQLSVLLNVYNFVSLVVKHIDFAIDIDIALKRNKNIDCFIGN
jgi:hypothetical protein